MTPNTDSKTVENHSCSSTVRVTLEIPCDHRFVSLARTAAVGLVAEHDPNVEEVDNLRLAVGELVSTIVDTSPGSSVRIDYELRTLESDSSELLVRVVPSDPSGSAANIDVLTRRILDSVTSEHQFLPDGSAELRFLQSRD